MVFSVVTAKLHSNTFQTLDLYLKDLLHNSALRELDRTGVRHREFHVAPGLPEAKLIPGKKIEAYYQQQINCHDGNEYPFQIQRIV